MKEDRDYIKDIAEIRTMMVRTSKFMSLSGWAGIMAGIYALTGAFIAWKLLDFQPVSNSLLQNQADNYTDLIVLALIVLVLAFATAILDAGRRARARGEKAWNTISRQLLYNMAIPLFTGGLILFILMNQGYVGFILPLSLVFYGLALFNGGRFTYPEVRILGFVEIFLGLAALYLVNYGLIFWAAGFGLAHIIYGIFMQFKYKK